MSPQRAYRMDVSEFCGGPDKANHARNKRATVGLGAHGAQYLRGTAGAVSRGYWVAVNSSNRLRLYSC